MSGSVQMGSDGRLVLVTSRAPYRGSSSSRAAPPTAFLRRVYWSRRYREVGPWGKDARRLIAFERKG